MAGGFRAPSTGKFVRAVLFDTFGTVVDWRTGIAAAVREFTAVHGLAVDPEAFADTWRGRYQPAAADLAPAGDWDLAAASITDLAAQLLRSGFVQDLPRSNNSVKCKFPRRQFTGFVAILLRMRRCAGIAMLVGIVTVMFSSGCGNVSSGASAGAEKASATWRAATARASAAVATPSVRRPPPGPSAQQLVSSAVRPLASADNDDVGVAVNDLTTGQWASFGGNHEFITASIAKADILATLLYQAQQSHGWISAGEQALATTMIEDSDNNAATALFADAGGPGGVDTANKAFGLRDTTAGPSPKWGITTTTPNDQIRLLRQIFTTPSVLSAASQAYIQRLMRHVEPAQAWGVPAAADSGTRFAVKNGWLPAPKLWAVNSIGSITQRAARQLIQENGRSPGGPPPGRWVSAWPRTLGNTTAGDPSCAT